MNPDITEIHYAIEDAILTALQQTNDGAVQPIGRATVKNGMERLQHLILLSAGPVLLSASKQNAVTTKLLSKSSIAA